MNFYNKLERKFGRYSIKNLPFVMLVLCAASYAIKYISQIIGINLIDILVLDPIRIVTKGQIWRLVTWLLIPPEDTNIIFVIIMLLFYYSISKSLVMVWGSFKYNLYIICGFIFTILGAFILWGIGTFIPVYFNPWQYFTTYYVNMSIFLAYAATFPENKIFLMMVLPIKVKWLGIVYGAILIINCIMYANIVTWPLIVVIVCSLLNFVLFYFVILGKVKTKVRQAKNNIRVEREQQMRARITKHKCAICGRSEETNPELTFRFCSKCNGNYEYCNEHLFTHTHVQ